jgi:ribosomal protein S18 acetylase RimI-like enzyme
VLPSHQRCGVYRSLLATVLARSREQGAEHLIISTQVTNVPAQKAWGRMGFEPLEARLTFHAWFNR